MQRAETTLERLRRLAPWALGALALSLSQPAEATVFRAISLDEMARRADAVAVLMGPPDTAAASRSYWLGRRIVTEQTLTVVGVLADRTGLLRQASGPLVLTIPGGRVGPHVQTVAGAPEPRPNAVQTVFLQRLRDGRWVVYDMALGLLPMRPDGRGGWWVSPPDTRGIERVDGDTGAAPLAMPAEGLSLTALQGRIERAAP
ncbi:MAG: hypothetical protein JNK72_06450 [Myxococcales bacterium]|nr:hypothetical protein [Myxococcales bacterium]